MNSFVPMDMAQGDIGGVKCVGEYTDQIFKHGKLVETRMGHNIVVNSFLVLTMLLMKNQEGFGGLQYWAVGSGSSGWDATPVEEEESETSLTNEIGRVPILPENMVFLDENYDETTVPTNIIQIVAEFSQDECNGEWREFGLFGGNATGSIGTGIMIDKKHHDLITKTTEITVRRKLRLSIQFS